jgi:hypothetical protein
VTTLVIKNDASTEVAQLLIDQVGTDEVATSKLTIGAAGVNDGFVSSANPLPVTGSVTATVSGVATAANQSTIIGHVDGIEGLLTTIDADTGNVATSVASIDTKTPSLGQALEAGSVPVVLTAAQLSTLTPPAAITGFATETTLAQLDGKVTACNTGAVTISAALPAGTNAIGKLAANNGVDIGDVDVTSVPADPFGANADAASATGSISAKLRFIASTGIPITGTVTVGSHAVTNAGTFAVQAAGDVAHDSADANSPQKIGAVAETALSGITLVADGDRTNLYAGVDGVLIVRPTTNLEDIVRGNTSNTDGNSTQVIAASGSASVKTYLTDITLTNTSSSMIYVEIKSGTTVMYTCPVPATGGFTKTFNPPLPPNAANEAWNVDASAATTTLYASMIGFKSKV